MKFVAEQARERQGHVQGASRFEKQLDVLIFFTDPLSALPHDVDVKALLRISTLCQIAVACNEMTADYILESRLMQI